MKTAISINDNLFKTVDKTAKKLGISRSNLFSKAIVEYLDNHDIQNVTEKLNKVYSNISNELERNTEHSQLSSVDFGEW